MIAKTDATDSPWVTLDHQGMPLLAAPLPEGLKPLHLKALAPSGEKLIWFFKGEVKHLPLEGWRRLDETTFLILPLFEGRSASPCPPFPGEKERMDLMSALAALEEYADQNGAGAEDPFLKELMGSPLQPGGIVFPEPGGVAFLRPSFAAAFLGVTGRTGPFWDLSSPSLPPSRQTAFSAALLIYRSLTGQDPFLGDEEARRERINKKIYLPLEYFIPALPQDFSRWITDALEGDPRPKPSFREGFSLLEEAGRLLPPGTDIKTAPPTEGESRRLTALKRFEKKERILKIQRFFRRRGALVAVVLAIIAGVAAVAAPMVTGALAPPLTRGWEPEEVVRGFYQGINDLDPELLDGVTAGKAGKQRRDQVTSLFAITRIRLGYEGVSPQISARDWVAGGQRPLKSGELLYGISALVVRRIEENRFLATYREWTSEAEEPSPAPPGDGEEGPAAALAVSAWEITEELSLERIRDAWMITGISQVSRQRIDLD